MPYFYITESGKISGKQKSNKNERTKSQSEITFLSTILVIHYDNE